MVLERRELNGISTRLTAAQCYQRIYDWHKKHGHALVEQVYGRKDNYLLYYLRLLRVLPSPQKATRHDIDFILGEVIGGLLEWAFHQEDKYGISIGAYAHWALQQHFPDGFNDPAFAASKKTSWLFKEFGSKKDRKTIHPRGGRK
jgi:hypothetical protein